MRAAISMIKGRQRRMRRPFLAFLSRHHASIISYFPRLGRGIFLSLYAVHSEGDQPWDVFGRNDAKAEILVLWPPHVKSWLIGKDFDAGRDWGQEKKGTTEDEMTVWHHWLDGHESEWTPGVGDGQGGLACCDSWGRRVGHDWATELNWTELMQTNFWV